MENIARVLDVPFLGMQVTQEGRTLEVASLAVANETVEVFVNLIIVVGQAVLARTRSAAIIKFSGGLLASVGHVVVTVLEAGKTFRE